MSPASQTDLDEAGRTIARLRALTPIVADRWRKLDDAMAATGEQLTLLFQLVDRIFAQTPPEGDNHHAP